MNAHPAPSMATRPARELRLTPLMLSMVCLGVTPTLAQTLPVPAATLQVDGTVAIQPGAPAGTMNIMQSSQRAIAAWQSFSIGAGGTVNVAQPSRGVLLNRVIGNDLSTIAGTLNAPNGHVYLVNPNGVLFSAGSSVNVGGIVASTLDISNANFMAGKQLVFERADGNAATVINRGSITAGPGGLVALMGAQAINEGSINVARGTAALVSGRSVTVDFEGDGLTRFTIPADSKATAALVQNAGEISANGGRIALIAASEAKAQVVNQSGVLRANALESRNGEIVLSAGATSKSDGSVVYTPNAMVVSGTIEASGGQVRMHSGQDITVTNLPPFVANSPTPTASIDSGSIVNAGALSHALGHASGVTLESAALQALQGAVPPTPVDSFSAGNGVRFDENTQVLKSEGGSATLTVNSARNILMAFNSSLASSSGALDIDFNADSAGNLSEGGRPGGAIGLEDARIESNGGNIRFYGQGDPVNGRAAGGLQAGAAAEDNGLGLEGILLLGSLVSTCAQGQAACSGGGSISLRGQGGTVVVATGPGLVGNSGAGVASYGSTLRSGGGAIAMDGVGGTGASGVRTATTEGGPSTIESNSGDIRITGSTRDWGGTTPTLYVTDDNNNSGDVDFGVGNGVTLIETSISTRGGVTLSGTGADTNGQLFANSGFAGTFGPSNGVLINASNITAGVGRQVAITGEAGSSGFTVAGGVVTADTSPAAGVAVNASAGQGAISAEGGSISVQGRNGSDVFLRYEDDSSEGSALTLLNVASASRAGGSIDIGGRNILVANTFGPTVNFLDARGSGSGGTIAVRSSGSIAVDQNSGMTVDALSPVGNAGTIRAVAAGDLRAHGSYSARGGQQGGNGGLIETSGSNLDLTGIRADASAPAGTAGTWLIDPFNVTIVDGAASGSLGTNPFVPLADSTIQDGDIDVALSGGTSVTIGTGAPDPASLAGNISFAAEASINVTAGTAPVTFRLEAARSISGFGTTIQSTAAPLNVEFAAGLGGVSGSINYNGDIVTNGGSVTMTALGNSGPCAICMSGTLIDTRVGGADGNPGGNVTLTVPGPGTSPGAGIFSTAAIDLASTDISTSTGNVGIAGFAQGGTGVRLDGTLFIGEGRLGVIHTTGGSIDITGVGAFSSNSADAPGHGVVIDDAQVWSVDGNIAVRGLRQAGGTPGVGVLIRNGTQVFTNGTGDIEITGESLGGAAGLLTTASVTNGQGQTFPGTVIAGKRHVVLRANNDGSADALALGGQVIYVETLDLRPGGVDAATGAGVDRTATPITLLGTGGTGFDLSAAEQARLIGFASGSSLVVGSNTHAGNIDVQGALSSTRPITLQNGGGGNINLAAPVSAPTLGLVSGGNITQSAGATITAGTLLAQSTGGNVILPDAGNNVSASTLGGGAAGRFEFVNSGPLRVGPVSVTAFDAAGNLPQLQAASSMVADSLLIRTLSGPLILDTSIGTASGADLVAATTFQNAGGGSLGGAPWRVWADTWVGETRGGIAGSGPLPNYYHCAYLGLCTVSVTPGDNHFVYAQQPTVTVNIGSFARNAGQPNPAFTYTLSGLILGDTGAGITGTMGTEANLQSPAGAYPVFGTFTSAEGYAVNVVPGTLLVGNVLPQPSRFVDVLREEPTTYVYDRNMGQAPICLATGPLQGDRAQQGNDVLAREWSRVRTRPNLTSCVDTERSNGCADF